MKAKSENIGSRSNHKKKNPTKNHIYHTTKQYKQNATIKKQKKNHTKTQTNKTPNKNTNTPTNNLVN